MKTSTDPNVLGYSSHLCYVFAKHRKCHNHIVLQKMYNVIKIK